jgi:hypothetical protein
MLRNTETVGTLLKVCHNIRTGCLRNLAAKHRDDVLEDYVVLCLWLSAQSSWLAYLGLANKTVVNKYLEEFSQYCQELAQVSSVKDKKHLVAS